MENHGEGVFPLHKEANGDLVDRLMAKIAELEAKLYEKDLQGSDMIAAVRRGHGSPSTEPTSTTHKKQLQQQPAEDDSQGSKGEWLSSVASTWMKGGRKSETGPHGTNSPGSKDQSSGGGGAAAAAAAAAGGFSWLSLKQMYKHATDSPEVETELQVTQQVRRAAHEAVMDARRRCDEAEEKLRKTEAARAELEKQLEAAAELGKEVEALKEENVEAWRTKYQLEQEVARMNAMLEGMQRQSHSAQQAIDDMHTQAQLWKSTAGGEVEKLRAENALVSGQLAARTTEVAERTQELAARAAELAGLQAEKDAVAAQLAAATAEAAARAEELAARAAELADLRSDRDAISGRLAAAAAEAAARAEQLTALQGERQQLAAQLAAVTAEAEQVRGGQLTAAVAEAAALRQEAAQLAQRLETAAAAAAAGAAGATAAKEQLSRAEKELSELQCQHAALKAAHEKLVQEHQQLTEQHRQLQQQLSVLSPLQAKLAAAEGHLAVAEAELTQLRAVAAEAEAKLAGLSALQGRVATAEGEVVTLRAAAAEADEKFVKERAVRRKLHEQLQVLRGNIRVMCRVRPPLPGAKSAITYPLEGLLAITDTTSGRHREFEFDSVFPPVATQGQVFEEVAPLVRSCADGYNACIFAYGQTGSGKTFTMEGPEDSPGINTRALQELFRIASEEPDKQWAFAVAVMEIYNESVHDLLGADVAKPLEVTALGAGELPPHVDRVQGLVWRKVANSEQVRVALREGSRNRATAATALNAASSRSHALVCVKVQAVSQGKAINSMLNLVDLAGSERVDRSEVAGQQMKEAQAINKSLSALGDVISALQRRTPHIPFRNSKLTQVLQDALCGSSKVLLVCQVSPELASCSETLSSLNFAQRAAQVELGQARRVTAEKVLTASGSGSGLAAEGSSGNLGGGSPGGSLDGGPSASSILRPGSRISGRAGSPSLGASTPPRSPSTSTLFAKPARH